MHQDSRSSQCSTDLTSSVRLVKIDWCNHIHGLITNYANLAVEANLTLSTHIGLVLSHLINGTGTFKLTQETWSSDDDNTITVGLRPLAVEFTNVRISDSVISTHWNIFSATRAGTWTCSFAFNLRPLQ